ncbi:MAG: hypothetical protein R3E79_35735 [Caldilineaceae bacterium]
MSFNNSRLSRRAFLQGAATSTSALLLAACVAQTAAPEQGAAAEGEAAAPDQAKPHLLWTGWNTLEFYGPVADEFMKETPILKSNIASFPITSSRSRCWLPVSRRM